jgi:DNA-binding response OmpR family regulator
MRILLVEDEHNVRRALSRSLAMHGHAVTEATSAAEAIAVICDQPCDLLVVSM